MNKNILYYLWLAAAFPYGSIKLGQILEQEPDACAFYHKVKQTVKEFPFLNHSDIEALRKHTPSEYRNVILESQKKEMHILCYTDDAYPARLRQIDSPPPVLYYYGDPTILEQRCVAIVGTRYPSNYGRQTTYQIARKLAAYGIVVLSGCAGGIDTTAHKGALEAGKTVAVLATPLDRNYPAFNAGLKSEIYRQGGLLITEYPIGAQIHRGFFPIRNRLIAAMSDMVLVMEAPPRSGALITASYALEYGKELFCLPPADISNRKYDGVKEYLRDGARPLLDANDVLECYRFQKNPILPDLPKWGSLEEKAEKAVQKGREKKQVFLSEGAKKVFSALSGQPHDVEELMQSVCISPNEIFCALTELELLGLIMKTGNGYCKK